MARIVGVDLPKEKRIEIGLTYIYGVGKSLSRSILENTKVNPDTKVKDLNDDEIKLLRDHISNELKVEGDLRRETAMNIKRLKEISCYRGIRHRQGLPTRGQNTRNNARTRSKTKKKK